MSAILQLIQNIPALIQAIMAIMSGILFLIKNLPIFIEWLVNHTKNAKLVKKELPDQKVTMVNMVQASADVAVNTPEKTVLKGPIEIDHAMENIESITASPDFKRIEAGK